MRIPHFDILMGVGAKYYPDPSFFIEECLRLGVSKRIAEFPPFYCPIKNRLWLVHWGTRKIFGFVTKLVIRLFVDSEDPICKAEKEKRAKFCGCDNPSCIVCAKFGDLPGDGIERGCGYLRPSRSARYIKRLPDGGGIKLYESDEQLRETLKGPWKKVRYRFKELKNAIINYITYLVTITMHTEWDIDQLYYTAKACSLFYFMTGDDVERIKVHDYYAHITGNPGCDIYVLYRAIPYTGPFTRGYRYVKVDLDNCKYTIIKIKVKKTKKERKECSLLDYTSYNTETKRVFPLKRDKQQYKINAPSSMRPTPKRTSIF